MVIGVGVEVTGCLEVAGDLEVVTGALVVIGRVQVVAGQVHAGHDVEADVLLGAAVPAHDTARERLPCEAWTILRLMIARLTKASSFGAV